METKDGFLVINKDKGCTSHDCVKQIRKLLNTKKVGHTGTLDPEVIGTLPIAIGSATRFIQYLPQGKTYIGKIKLGIRTNTDDIQGEIISQKSWPKISDEKLDQYLNRFRGIIKQIPPKVSSVHVNGERAYKKSFRNENFELAPREVKIDELTLMKWDQINGIIEIKIKCSAGTYIRAIARFYKDTKRGFATNDGYYAIPSKGKSLAIVHNGEILKFCRNEESARNFVDKLRKKK